MFKNKKSIFPAIMMLLVIVSGALFFIYKNNKYYGIVTPISWYQWTAGDVDYYSPLPKPVDLQKSKQLWIYIKSEKLPNDQIKSVKDYNNFYTGTGPIPVIPGPGDIVSTKTEFTNLPDMVEVSTAETEYDQVVLGLKTKEFKIIGKGKIFDIVVRYEMMNQSDYQAVIDFINSLKIVK